MEARQQMSDHPNKPSQADLGLFPAPTTPTMALLREAQDKTDSTPALVQGVAALFGLPSVHLGRVAG